MTRNCWLSLDLDLTPLKYMASDETQESLPSAEDQSKLLRTQLQRRN